MIRLLRCSKSKSKDYIYTFFFLIIAFVHRLYLDYEIFFCFFIFFNISIRGLNLKDSSRKRMKV